MEYHPTFSNLLRVQEYSAAAGFPLPIFREDVYPKKGIGEHPMIISKVNFTFGGFQKDLAQVAKNNPNMMLTNFSLSNESNSRQIVGIKFFHAINPPKNEMPSDSFTSLLALVSDECCVIEATEFRQWFDSRNFEIGKLATWGKMQSTFWDEVKRWWSNPSYSPIAFPSPLLSS
jgi:hypothetical protein